MRAALNSAAVLVAAMVAVPLAAAVPEPEPATLALIGAGLAGLAALRRRRAP